MQRTKSGGFIRDNGEYVSRRQEEYERRGRDIIKARDKRYEERKSAEAKLRGTTKTIITEQRKQARQHAKATGEKYESPLGKSKRYIRRRAAENQTGLSAGTDPLHDVTVDMREAEMTVPASVFERLWRTAQSDGFVAREGGSLDDLLLYAGMLGFKSDNDRERYLALIKWYIENRSLPYAGQGMVPRK